MLSLNNVEVVYDGAMLVLKGVSLRVQPGSVTALLGGNGAGKTTTLRAISGLLRTERGAITKGTIEFEGARLDRHAPHDIVSRGIVQVFEGRGVFEHLSVQENLVAGGHTCADGRTVQRGIDLVYSCFPRLKERRMLEAGYLSGGEQQMLAIGRALMAQPKLVMLDEPSLGLAPMVIDEIFDIVRRLVQSQGIAVLLVEQNAVLALSLASYGYVMESGRIMLQGEAGLLAQSPDVKEFYLGLNSSGARKSYQEVKRYRRRKRWL